MKKTIILKVEVEKCPECGKLSRKYNEQYYYCSVCKLLFVVGKEEG